MRIAVTGGSGKLGRSVIRRLGEDGHSVLNLDRTGLRSPALALVDLRNYGQVLDVLLGVVDVHVAFFSEETGVDWNVIFLLLGMMINVPFRAAEYLAAIPPIPVAAPGWLSALHAAQPA